MSLAPPLRVHVTPVTTLLAARLSATDAQVSLLARGEALEAIRRQGIMMVTPLRRVVSAEQVLGPQTLALARAVAQRWAGTTADVLRLAIPPRHARVERSQTVEPDSLVVNFDPHQLHQVLWNLCANACHHGVRPDASPRVELRAGLDPGRRRPFLEVRDAGPGISEDNVVKLFTSLTTLSVTRFTLLKNL